MRKIVIAKQFARYPFGRYRSDGPYSGQVFREDLLEPALQDRAESVEVILDGAIGMGSSFLEEAFGGLIRSGFTLADLHDRMHISSRVDPALITEIEGYLAEADANLPQNQRRRA